MSHVLVTGGSAGIGLALCRAFLARGDTVTSLDRAPATMTHDRLRTIGVDLTDTDATRAAAAEAMQTPVTTLIHNAGAILPALVDQASADDLATLARLHLGAALVLVQAALPGMRAAGFGRIVLISSRAALGLATRTAYSATKAGLIGLARTWALELGPDGITVNAVAPGPIAETPMFHDVLPPGDPVSAPWRGPSRSVASAGRRTWRTPSCSWPIRPAVSSPGRPCSSAAAPAWGA